MNWPFFDDQAIEDVVNILKSGKVNQWTGQTVKKFEEEFSNYLGGGYTIALMNGSVAIELALIMLDLKENDEVIVTPRSFIASVSSVLIRGGKPVFADVDDYGNLSPESIRTKITDKTKGIILVHLAGYPAELDQILKIKDEFKLWLIEDCAQCHGAKYNNQHLGTFGDIGCWSFCQDKIMTTGGEGGMVMTKDYSQFLKGWSYKDHGKDFTRINENGKSFKWWCSSIGTNWRMTEMQASLGLWGLSHLDEWIRHRREIASIYNSVFRRCDKIIVRESQHYSSYYKYYFYLKNEFAHLKEKLLSIVDFPLFYGSCSEIYLEEAIIKSVDQQVFCPNSHLLGKTSLMMLTHPGITIEQAKEWAQSLIKCLDSCII